jgi:uroporphyrinogen III methyltransferase/synthase
VLPDGLVSDEILALIEGPELIPVGKRYGSASTTQAEINALLVRLSLEGKSVCRLKGGDPMVFGRAGEEMQFLVSSQIPYEIVPGVTSATAAAAYAGIPLTLRGLTAGFVCVSGHRASNDQAPDTDWDSLAHMNQTLVILMAATRIDSISENLIRAGMSPRTPCAIIENASMPGQRTIVTSLRDIAPRSHAADIHTPAVLIVGEVVTSSRSLQWLPVQPLSGQRILTTSPTPADRELRDLLGAAGATVLAVPAIEIKELSDVRPLRSVLHKLDSYSWVVFTSRNGVNIVFGTLKEMGADARAFGSLQIAALGPGTARALRKQGIEPDLIPETYISESVVDTLLTKIRKHDHVLEFGAQEGRTVIHDQLLAADIPTSRLDTYQTIPAVLSPDMLRNTMEEPPDWIVFTSPTAVEAFVNATRQAAITFSASTQMACIGPITGAALQSFGIPVHATGNPHTYAGLVATIVNIATSDENKVIESAGFNVDT